MIAYNERNTNKNSNDMKEEILSIASDLREGFITSNEAKEQLLVLFGVSKCLHPFDNLENINNLIMCNKCNEWLTNVC